MALFLMNLTLIKKIPPLRAFIQNLRKQGKTIALVPTMGYLHAGHQALMKRAKKECDIVIVSIFVNPLQFGPAEDLDKYPRHLEGDIALCEDTGVTAIFAPDNQEMFPNGKPYTSVNIHHLDRYLCGASRPGHFAGVCTIVSKLFNLVMPDKAFFGRKDIQQLRIIETMTRDLNFPIEIVGCDTVRIDDGLALSSRNSYLSPQERAHALIVPQLLQYLIKEIEHGIRETATLIEKGQAFLYTFNNDANSDLKSPSKAPVTRLDYLQIVDYENLQPLETVKEPFIIATAIFVGKTRLIDNVIMPLCQENE